MFHGRVGIRFIENCPSTRRNKLFHSGCSFLLEPIVCYSAGMPDHPVSIRVIRP